MKLTYLGTAAAEGIPAIFCNCEYCREARRLGGKNIRTRSQALVNDDLLIDFPADTYAHFLNNGIEGDTIGHLLVTHSHSDHLYIKEFLLRHTCYAHGMRAPVLNIYGSKTTCGVIGDAPPNIALHVLSPFLPTEVGDYRVTALPAKHMFGFEPYIYLIEGEKTLLYAHDTGYFYDEVFEYIEKQGIVLDMISLDCTNVDIPEPDEGGHMAFDNLGRVLERLKKIGAVTDATVKYVNHFSHNGNPLQHLLEARAAEYGCLVSYDGCKVEF